LATLFLPLKNHGFFKKNRSQDMVETISQQAYSDGAVKIDLSLCLCLGFCALAPACVHADDDNYTTVKPPYDPDINSPTYDGSTYQAGQNKKPTAADIQAAREAQQEDANWLVRGYDEQLKKSASTGQNDLFDPEARTWSDPDFAKLAGLTSILSPGPVDITSHHAATDSSKDGSVSRPDSSQTSTSSSQKLSSLSIGSFKPFITPLSATDAAGLPNFYATLPAGLDAPTPTAGRQLVAPPAKDDSAALEMPGLTAAQSRFTAGDLNYDIMPDPLPDEAPDSTRLSSGDGVLPQVPSGDAAKQLQRTVMVVTTGKPAPQPGPAKIVTPPDPTLTPKPLSTPIIVAGRPQIQDPNDFVR
jgi:hypothetical protein